MKTVAVIATVMAAALNAGCGGAADGPPGIDVDRTPCAHCGMLISEPVYAAAYRAPGSQPRIFDDIRCLLEAANQEPNVDALRFWFHDAASTVWIDGKDAVFVMSSDLRTPMGGGLIAFRDRTAAQETAGKKGHRLVRSLGELLRQAPRGEGGS
jgi:copper chaperone NosL